MTRLIKRYDNRKLYDTHARSYVSLEDLAALIRQGYELQVVDNSTGVDITAQTLTKVILETSRPWLPSEVLHELVRWGGRMMYTTAGELERGFDGLLMKSLERLGVVREIRRQFEQLYERLASLEKLTGELSAALNESPGGERHAGRHVEGPDFASIRTRQSGHEG